MLNIKNEKIKTEDKQSFYDSFNNFIMDEDRKVFFKLEMRSKLYDMVKDKHGDIVECGVFKGSGLFVWLKLLSLYEPNSIKKVIGFDFFDQTFIEKIDNKIDKMAMKEVFTRDSQLTYSDISLESISQKIIKANFNSNQFELIPGDISITSKEFLKDRPGFRISLLYLDLNLEIPTYDSLVNLYDRVVPGGLIVFDEYAYHVWSESNAVDKFIKERNLKINNTRISAPTAYIIKPE